ncbi:hypothetical protein [Draconibacterium sp.]|uniref:hypothetical protein n=1 Tax=Draconibacterium sp. TaxID=1965318 RepID=UPI00356439B9
MKNEHFGVILTEERYLQLKGEANQAKTSSNEQTDLEKERISKPEAAKLIGRSLPYLNKLIREGIFRQYGFGKRGKFLLRSEVLEVIRNSNL